MKRGRGVGARRPAAAPRRPLHAALLAVAIAGSALAVSGCAALYDPAGFAAAVNQTDGQAQADAALAALARGDYAEAERRAQAALDRDPRNPHALLAAGVVYHNTDRPSRARQMYEDVIALRSRAVVSGPWWGGTPRPVGEVAADNLRSLDADPVRPRDGAADIPAPGVETPEERRFAILDRLRGEGLVTAEEYRARRAANLGALLPLSAQPPASGLERPAPAVDQVVERLQALRAAFESRNLSAGQHAAERSMILDGLLPAEPRARALPALPPAGVMEAAAMVGRLERLREQDLVTAAEQARERAAIERAVRATAQQGAPAPAAQASATPAAPVSKPDSGAAPAPRDRRAQSVLVPPAGTGNPAAALRTGRGPVEVLPSPVPGEDDRFPGDGDVLAAAQRDAQQDAQQGAPSGADQADNLGAAGGVAVHLASFRTPERAERGWAELQQKFPSLQGLRLRVTQIDLPGQGTFHRLMAGPLADRAAAEALCAQLTDQYCRPVFASP